MNTPAHQFVLRCSLRILKLFVLFCSNNACSSVFEVDGAQLPVQDSITPGVPLQEI